MCWLLCIGNTHRISDYHYQRNIKMLMDDVMFARGMDLILVLCVYSPEYICILVDHVVIPCPLIHQVILTAQESVESGIDLVTR
jgi:hypothetical protein